MDNKKFYVTTAIPYVNAAPHIGHALEFVQADVITRYHTLLGDRACLLSGADENSLKVVQAAETAGKTPQELADEISNLFKELAKELDVNFDFFQRGSDQEHHFSSSQKLWELCKKNGDIYKKAYKGLYCVGCEIFYTPGELNENAECFEHPGKKLDVVEEENYFFKLSRYQKQLENLIESDELKIIPTTRKNEALAFIKQGLEDFSISRSKKRAKGWGVPVPGDPSQVIYVWFDALNIYQSGIGFGWDDKLYKKLWPADVHVIGKGIIRFHAIFWPAILLSAKLQLPKSLFVHGYLTVDGQKMSKTIGNVIDPFQLIKKYGVDPLRYYLLREIPAYGDGDFSENRFKELYNADLANGLGNLAARVAKLCEHYNFKTNKTAKKFSENVVNFTENFEFNYALNSIWGIITLTDVAINNDKLWEGVSTQRANEALSFYVENIRQIAFDLQPFLPETAEKILKQFASDQIKSQPPLFPRI